jgi:hypothetical protein
MPLAGDRIFNFDVMFGEIFNYFGLFLIFTVTVTQFTVAAAAERIKLP